MGEIVSGLANLPSKLMVKCEEGERRFGTVKVIGGNWAKTVGFVAVA